MKNRRRRTHISRSYVAAVLATACCQGKQSSQILIEVSSSTTPEHRGMLWQSADSLGSIEYIPWHISAEANALGIGHGHQAVHINSMDVS
jgi:hypothetical protein